jgi:hypothetical protein
MYLMANIALIVEFFRFRRAGVRKNPLAWVVTPVIGVLVLAIPVWGGQAVSLLEGEVEAASGAT